MEKLSENLILVPSPIYDAAIPNLYYALSLKSNPLKVSAFPLSYQTKPENCRLKNPFFHLKSAEKFSKFLILNLFPAAAVPDCAFHFHAAAKATYAAVKVLKLADFYSFIYNHLWNNSNPAFLYRICQYFSIITS